MAPQKPSNRSLRNKILVCLVFCTAAAAQTIYGEGPAAVTQSGGIPNIVEQRIASNNSNKQPAIVSSSGTNAYRIKNGDKLAFALLNTGYEETANPLVDKQGNINLPLVGVMNVAGKTVGNALASILEHYGQDYFVNPRIKLTVEEKAKIQYKILGQVASPGFYEVPPSLNINLLDAIAIAGGYTRLAGKITLKRPMEVGADQISTYKIKQLTKLRSAEIPDIKGHETIVIGETFF